MNVCVVTFTALPDHAIATRPVSLVIERSDMPDMAVRLSDCS